MRLLRQVQQLDYLISKMFKMIYPNIRINVYCETGMFRMSSESYLKSYKGTICPTAELS